MATQVQFHRGSNTQSLAYTGPVGELTVNTTSKQVHVHDGAKAGGYPVNHIVNVLSFGAVGDGTVDDGPAINSAIEFASTIFLGGQVYVPAGTFKTLEPIYLKANITLQGAGKTATKIKAGVGFTGLSGVVRCPTVGTTAQAVNNVHIVDLEVDANKAQVGGQDLNPIFFQGGTPARGDGLSILRVIVRNGNKSVDGGIGIGVGGYDNVLIENCESYDNENNGFDLNQVRRGIIKGCVAVGNSINQFFAGHGSEDIWIDSCYGTGAAVVFNVYHDLGNSISKRFNVTDCTFISSANHAVYINAIEKANLTNCTLVSAGAGSFKYPLFLQQNTAALLISGVTVSGGHFSNGQSAIYTEGDVQYINLSNVIAPRGTFTTSPTLGSTNANPYIIVNNCDFGLDHASFVTGINGDLNAPATASKATEIGYRAVARIPQTVNLGGPIIARKDNGETAADSWVSFAGAEVYLFGKILDAKTLNANTTIPIPAGCWFMVTELGIIGVQIGGVGVAPTIKFGDAIDDDRYKSAQAIGATFDGGRSAWSPDFTDGVDSARTGFLITIASAATATNFIVRPYVKGFILEKN